MYLQESLINYTQHLYGNLKSTKHLHVCIALLGPCDKPIEEKKVSASIFLGQKGLEV